ncbi:hypothetical protein ACTWP6_15795 [Mycobacterium sp. 4D054]|uniref:hypothetical protein n=1 Tax=Mycobacterium sp. 4D054 TaxID=3457440 RepID=UPI003FD4C9B9
MFRTFAALAATASLLGSTVVSAAAQPAPVSACAYELSSPAVVNVSGTDMVAAALTIGACDGAVTYATTVCIQMQGDAGPGQCARGFGLVPAQVFFQPYRPGLTYTATGRGCASKGNPPQQHCQESGPLTATL